GAVTSRRIAERVGLSHQSVFYYFGSLDELFIALIQRNSEAFRMRLHSALETDAPVRALWTIACDRESAVIELELKAMSMHNARVRAAMTESLQVYRRIAADFLSRHLPARWAGQPAKAWALVLVLES